MPQAAPRPCRQPGCPNTTLQGFCEQHRDKRSNWNRQGRGSAAQRGYGAAWRTIRARILRRDKHLCQSCQRRAANEVDHIIGKAEGGTDEASNLQAICTRCHRAKTAQESRG